MAAFHNLRGTTQATFQIGKSGTLIKENSGTLEVRDSADSAYASLTIDDLTTNQVEIIGNTISTRFTNADLELDGNGSGDVVILSDTLELANLGFGVASVINFAKSNDSAQIRVTEYNSDNTAYNFIMTDNPNSSADYFQWAMLYHGGDGGDWVPLKFNNFNLAIQAADTRIYGQVTVNDHQYFGGNNTESADGYQGGGLPGQHTLYTVTGSLDLSNIDVSGFTNSSEILYTIIIDGTGSPNTFKYTHGTRLASPVATTVNITGAAQSLDNGITITFDGTTGGDLDDEFQFTVIPGGSVTAETLRLNSTTDASLSSTDHALQIGATSGDNVLMDSNELLARSNGSTATLFLQLEGGDIRTGGGMSIGQNDAGVATNDGVDIFSGGVGLVMGGNSATSTRTDATNKFGRIAGAHYTNAEEPMAFLYGNTSSAANALYIGGGSSSMNAATTIRFHTAANNTTVTGTERLRIDAAGDLTIAGGQLIGPGDPTTGTHVGDRDYNDLRYNSLISVEDEGGEIVSNPAILNFVGAGVTVTDGGANEAIITITSGGGAVSVRDDSSTLITPVDTFKFGESLFVTDQGADEVEVKAVVQSLKSQTTNNFILEGVETSATSYNYLRVTSNDSGANPKIEAFGIDADIDVEVGVVGDGALKLVGSSGDATIDITGSGDTLRIVGSGGAAAIDVTTAGNSLDIDGTGALTIPDGTTGERPAGVAGAIRWNSSLVSFEGFTDEWENILVSDQLFVDGNNISSLFTNADIELDPAGTGNLKLISGDLIMSSNSIVSNSSTGQIRFTNDGTGPGFDNWINFDLGENYQYGTTITAGGSGGNIIRFSNNTMIADNVSWLLGNQSAAGMQMDTGGSDAARFFTNNGGGSPSGSGYFLFTLQGGSHNHPNTTGTVDYATITATADSTTFAERIQMWHTGNYGNLESVTGDLNLISPADIVANEITFSGTTISANTTNADLNLDIIGTGIVAINSGASIGNSAALTKATASGLDIISGGLSLILGADSGASTRTDATNKYGKFGAPHYTNAEEPTTGIIMQNTSVNNQMFIGGSEPGMNAATNIIFYTAANNTTITGTERMRIHSSGDVTIQTGGNLILIDDPTLDTHVGDRGYNDIRYAAVAVTGVGFGIATGDSGTATADIQGDTLQIAGGANITTTASDGPEQVSIALDSAVTGLTQLTVDNIDINGNTINVTGDLTITATGQQIFIPDQLVLSHTSSISSGSGDGTGALFAPRGEAHILGAGGGGISLNAWNSNENGVAILALNRSDSNVTGTHSALVDNDRIGRVVWNASDGTDFGTSIAMIEAEVDDASPAASDIGGAIVFHTASGTGANDISEQMRIDATGLVTAATFVGALTGTASNATVAATSTIADSGDDTTLFVIMATDAIGDEALLSDAQLTYNASTNALTTTTFIGALTGNASTATALETGRTIGISGDVAGAGVSFDGTSNITIISTTVDSVQLNSVNLGSDTVGNFVDDVSGTANEIAVTHTPAEGSTATIGLATDITIPNDLTVTGDLIVSTTDAITAAGTTQGGATALTTTMNNVTTVTGAAAGVVLPTAAAGIIIYVSNDDSADTLNVYPNTSDNINDEAVNTAIALGAGASITFIAANATKWIAFYGVMA